MAVSLHLDCLQQSQPTDGRWEHDAGSSVIRARPDPRGLFSAASDADASASRVVDLARIWQDFVDGRLQFHFADRTRSRQYVVARTDTGKRQQSGTLSPLEMTILVRVLCGEPQKVIALELGIACSTTSKWFARALEKLNLKSRTVPLPLVAAAHSWALGRSAPLDTRSGFFEYDGSSLFFLSVSRPIIGRAAALTPSECEIARSLVEGDSRREIAMRRATSAQTVATQVGAIFSKLGLRGRYPLIRRGADLGWFR